MRDRAQMAENKKEELAKRAEAMPSFVLKSYFQVTVDPTTGVRCTTPCYLLAGDSLRAVKKGCERLEILPKANVANVASSFSSSLLADREAPQDLWAAWTKLLREPQTRGIVLFCAPFLKESMLRRCLSVLNHCLQPVDSNFALIFFAEGAREGSDDPLVAGLSADEREDRFCRIAATLSSFARFQGGMPQVKPSAHTALRSQFIVAMSSGARAQELFASRDLSLVGLPLSLHLFDFLRPISRPLTQRLPLPELHSALSDLGAQSGSASVQLYALVSSFLPNEEESSFKRVLQQQYAALKHSGAHVSPASPSAEFSTDMISTMSAAMCADCFSRLPAVNGPVAAMQSTRPASGQRFPRDAGSTSA